MRPVRPCLVAALMACAACGCADRTPAPQAGALFVPAPVPDVEYDSGLPTAADANRDGRADLLLPTGRRLLVLLSDGDRFKPAPGPPVPLPQPAGETATGDFNKDGKIDVALASHDSYAVTVLLGDGTGRFAAAQGSPFASKKGQRPHTHGLVTGDFNNDANLDLVLANNADGDLSLLLGDGKGGFSPAPRSPFACGPQPYPIAAADVDGDGNLDVLVPNSLPADTSVRTMTVLRGDGRGTLAAGPPVPLAGAAFFVTAGDLNGDGKVDAVVTHSEGDDGATLLLGDGRGDFAPAPASPLRLGHNCWCVAIVDINRDGQADLVAAGGDAVRVFLGDGRGSYAAAPGSPYITGKGTWRFCLADFTGDGKLDLAIKCVEDRKLVVLLGR